MKKQPERTELTRKVFIDTFLELCCEKTIDEITVKGLTERAGYNRSTFYQYFNDVYHLLTFLEDEMIQYIMDTVVKQIGKAKPESVFVEVFESVYENRRKQLQFLLGRNSHNSFTHKLKKELIPAFAIQMQLSLENEANLYLLDFYLSGMISVISRWVSYQKMMPPEEFAHLISRIVEGVYKSELLPITIK